jgi:hypothetical protein
MADNTELIQDAYDGFAREAISHRCSASSTTMLSLSVP